MSPLGKGFLIMYFINYEMKQKMIFLSYKGGKSRSKIIKVEETESSITVFLWEGDITVNSSFSPFKII